MLDLFLEAPDQLAGWLTLVVIILAVVGFVSIARLVFAPRANSKSISLDEIYESEEGGELHSGDPSDSVVCTFDSQAMRVIFERGDNGNWKPKILVGEHTSDIQGVPQIKDLKESMLKTFLHLEIDPTSEK